MNPAVATIRSHIEPAAVALPRRVLGYAWRRNLPRYAPPAAFWFGMCFGALAVTAGAVAALVLSQ